MAKYNAEIKGVTNELLLTLVIPAFNAEKHLNISLPSILNKRLLEEDIMQYYEVLIVNDGSTDKTLTIAKKWASKWNKLVRKNFVKVIDKKNGQYGSVINKTIPMAHGRYFKVLDADDHFHVTSFIQLIYMLRGLKRQVDVVLTDFVFEKVGTEKQILESLRNTFEPNKIFNLKGQTFPTEIITMHSIIYRTKLLKNTNYKQIEGVYYSDSQYSIIPMMKAHTMYYINIPLYRYYVGRLEQSINMKVMVKNRLHQLTLVHHLLQEVDLDKVYSKKVATYLALAVKKMIQWQIMLIAFDKGIKNKPKVILDFIQDCKILAGKDAHKIVKGVLIRFVLLTRGRALEKIIMIGAKLYSKFKLNILAEWDET